MKNLNIVRALKNGKYRNELSDAQRAIVGENPAGVAELDDAALKMVSGAGTMGCPATLSIRGTFGPGCCMF